MSYLPCPSCNASLDISAAVPDACPRCSEPFLIDGRFRLQRFLGRSDAGLAYGAREEPGGGAVVVKFLVPGRAGDWDAVELLARGARVLRSLAHPGLPRVYAVLEDGAGRRIVVREALEGGSLEERILVDHRHLDPTSYRRLLEKLLRTVAYLHGLVPPAVHSDLRPANVRFRTRDDWNPVLVDLLPTTLAERRAGAGAGGTPGYAPPEQIAGEVSPATDLYAVGAIMLMVAMHDEPGVPAADAELADLDQLVNVEPAVRGVLQRLVEPDPRRRYARAEDALADLVPLSRPGVTRATTALVPRGAPPLPAAGPATPLLVRGLAAFGILFLSSLVGLLWFGHSFTEPVMVGPAPGQTCTVRSYPSGAIVTEGHRPLGRTPLTLRHRAPSHVLISKAGFRPAYVQLPLLGPCAVNVTLARLPGRVRPSLGATYARRTATLSLRSSPAGAKVTVDGQVVGTTPLTIDVPLGVHVVRFERGGKVEVRMLRVSGAHALSVRF